MASYEPLSGESDTEYGEEFSNVNLPEFLLQKDLTIAAPFSDPFLENDRFRKFALTWNDLSVSHTIRQEKWLGFVKRSIVRRIVQNISGTLISGELVALIGPSGAGKSTILSALAGRSHGSAIITGDIRLNGQKVDDSIRTTSGYMYQEDYFISVLTVREHLRYTARLKMDRRTSQRGREHRIESLMEATNLAHLANSRIGGLAADGQKGILSGGERKRLSFAAACLTFPPLLFADEPTTGLDSFTATRLVSLMKSIVLSTRASMMATIHQPSPDILAMFDRVVIVADGRLIFTGTVENGVDLFRSCGFKMSGAITDAEFLLECVAPQPDYRRGEPVNKRMSGRRLAANFEASEHYSEIEETIRIYAEEKTPINFDFKRQIWVVQLFWLTVRGIVEMAKNPNVQWIRIGQKILIALTAGICYFGPLEVDQKRVQGIQGALFLMVTENVFAPMYAVMAVFPKEYPLFIREYRNGAYSPSAYYLSKILCYGPGAALEAIIFTSILYVLAGLRLEFYPYALTVTFSVLCINVAIACGSFFSNAFSSIPTAMMYLLPVEYISMITSGIFIKLSSLPWLTSWIRYISWFMYTYESLTVVQWKGVQNITCPFDGALQPTCLLDGDDVLERYDFSETHLVRNFLSLVAIYVILHIFGYKCFVRKIKKHL